MPLETYSSREALERFKANSARRLMKRRAEGAARALPIPITPKFSIPRGASIFTVGSCFARNIETILKEFGLFRLPALELPEDVLAITEWATGALNKYTLPAIANEIRWAFDDFDGLPLEAALFPVSGDECWDSQMYSAPDDLPTYEGALARRQTVNASYRALENCDVAIITLGLVETWRSKQYGFYCNSAPPRPLLRSEEFELCLLRSRIASRQAGIC